MTETMYICGLSMEMRMAEEMGTIGKCIGCHHFDKPRDDVLFCHKKDEILMEEQEDCEDWLVDHR